MQIKFMMMRTALVSARDSERALAVRQKALLTQSV